MKLSELDPGKFPDGFKMVAEVCTSHITAGDAALLNRDVDGIGAFAYGWFVETWSPEVSGDLIALGFSLAYACLMSKLHEKGIYYVCFDSDAPEFDDLPMFDW